VGQFAVVHCMYLPIVHLYGSGEQLDEDVLLPSFIDVIMVGIRNFILDKCI